MAVVISLLRAVNLGSHNKVGMSALKTLYESLDLSDVQTYVQSGNVVCRARHTDLRGLAALISDAFEAAFGFRTSIVMRTLPELRSVVARNPFATREAIAPNRLLVTFLNGDPARRAAEEIRGLDAYPEELHLIGRELYIHYPNGAGRSRLPAARLEKAIGVPGTARNWNTVLRLLDIAEALERGAT
jgi:uncharacterized protein (DUF1697 family)